MKQITLAIFCMVTLTSLSCMAQTHNGHEYVDLGLPSGTLWATCNIGATTPEGYGDYFAWGETKPKTSYDWGNYAFGYNANDEGNFGMNKYNQNDKKETLALSDDAAAVNWEGDWRMPTQNEFHELQDKCSWIWTVLNNTKGYKIVGSNGNSIFLPAGGCTDGISLTGIEEGVGYYWLSTLYVDIPRSAYNMLFEESNYKTRDAYWRCMGFPIRPVCRGVSPDIQDEPVGTFEVGGIYYNSLGGDSVEVTYKGESYDAYENEYTGAVVIPTTVAYNGKTYRVTAIADCTFLKCSNLTAITIPNSVTTIGEAAFEYCVGLAEVTISNSVTTIGAEAFLGCSSLTTITIPNSVTIISEEMFADCNNLTEVILPNSVTTIEMGAFAVCSALAKITLPNSLTTIGDAAFGACTNLTEITIPNSMTSIGAWAFERCSLATITCLAITPPQISENTFDEVNRSIPLYVSEGSVDAYKAADYWKEFFNIQGVSGNTSGVETNFMRVSDEEYKLLENGTIYILRDSEKYTLDGRRVE